MKKILITERQLSHIIESEISGAILLRKMNRKSVFNGGKYDGVTVQEILNLKKHPYLRWVYYNMSMITFMDDILDELHITEDLRIDKPGKNPEFGDEVAEFFRLKQSFKQKKHNEAKSKKYKNFKLLSTYYEPWSKDKLAKRNQGHPVSIYSPKTK